MKKYVNKIPKLSYRSQINNQLYSNLVIDSKRISIPLKKTFINQITNLKTLKIKSFFHVILKDAIHLQTPLKQKYRSLNLKYKNQYFTINIIKT